MWYNNELMYTQQAYIPHGAQFKIDLFAVNVFLKGLLVYLATGPSVVNTIHSSNFS